MNQRCAIYARYSSDNQSPLSIVDQTRKCREYAQQRHWSVVEGQIYTDAETSGAGTDRPGLQDLLRAVKRRPQEFDVLLIEDTSRLSRNLGHQQRIAEELKFYGITIDFVTQGFDTANEQSDVLMAVHGLKDGLYIKDLAKKTHRGLEGRALNGQHTGGRCFGYRSEHGADGVRLVVEESEAAVVRRIFEMSASGLSLKAIARTLNGEAIPSPRRSNGSGPATWSPTGIRAMLRNELYIGRRVWNRRKWIEHPGTNNGVPESAPPSEWKIVHQPELRIVDDNVWQRVKDRQRRLEEVYGHAGAGIHKASSSCYLLMDF